jgi:hypothetical protein
MLFMPRVVSGSAGEWIVRRPESVDFRALKQTIDECLASLGGKNKNPLLTARGHELHNLIDLLEAQIPIGSHPVTLIQYKELHKLKVFDGASAQMAAVALKKWEIEIGRKFDEYVLEFNTRHRDENEMIEVRQRIVSNLRRDLEGKLAPKLFKARRLPWRLLEPGRSSFRSILEHFDGLNTPRRKEEYDRHRLELVHALGPSAIYIGVDEFEWYIVFLFRSAGLAILECPIKGNAIYLIGGDWKELSRLSKTALLEGYSGEVARIVHAGDWYGRLKSELRACNRRQLKGRKRLGPAQ